MSEETSSIRPGVGLAGPLVLMLLLVALGWAAGDRMLRLEFTIFDLVQQRVPAAPNPQILLVDTGRAADSLWTDERLPAAIERLAGAGSAAIIPSQPPPASSGIPDLEQLAKLFKLEKQSRRDASADSRANMDTLDSQLAGFRRQFETQAAIQSALAASGRAVLPLASANPRSLGAEAANPCVRLALAEADAETPALSSVRPARELLALPSSLCDTAAAAGYAGFRPDLDGTVRETALLVKAGEEIVPTLAVAAVAAAIPGQRLEAPAADRLAIGDHLFETGAGFTILHRSYPGADKASAFETISLDELLSDELDSSRLGNRLVLLGPMDADPSYRTPLATQTPGMILLATSISNLLQSDYAVRPEWLQWSELGLLIALAALFVVLIPGMSLNAAALSAIFLGALLLLTEVYLLLAHGIWTRLGMAAVFCTLGVAAIHALRYLRHTQPLMLASAQPAMGVLSDADELDLAFSVLRQQAPNDDTKERLYGIAVTHGRRKEFAKAERVLRYLASIDPDYRGVQDKLKKLSGARRKNKDALPPAADDSGNLVKSSTKRKRDASKRTLGRYEVDKVIGRGAMATVYLGRDPKINRPVAIKTIALADEFSDEDLQAAKEQFLREAESAGRLNHANIIAIYDVGEDDDVAYLAMEYFEGKSLHHFAQPANLLPPHWVLELGARAAEALHYAHGQRVVHRDIKPANILYNAASDELKLTDFGIARLTDTSRTKTGIILGTPSYMSPEQLAGNPVTGQSDLYSLGITLYHLLTGAPPFRADSIPKLMDKIVNERHPVLSTMRDDLPPCVDDLFDRALAKNPDDRFANGRAMALALRDCCSSFSS